MFGRVVPSQENLACLERVEGWTRSIFDLTSHDLVMVSQDPGRWPGFPPLQTTVLFWHEEERFKIVFFKPVAEVLVADMPLAWMRPALRDFGDECC